MEDASIWKSEFRDLSDRDLAGVVAQRCSVYGIVKNVAIHIAHAHLHLRAFALVDMSELAGAERLAAAFNRPCLGNTVVLLLEP